MKTMAMKWILSACLVAGVSAAFAQGRDIRPERPEETVQRNERSKLMDQASLLANEGRLDEAISVLEKAAAIEAKLPGFHAVSQYELARVLVQVGRSEEALKAYAKVFRWNDRRGDLEVGTGEVVMPIMDYAILLAQTGRSEEAKAMYYFGLRNLNLQGERSKEPVPFVVVFDEEADGVVWEYSPEKLQAAALMAKLVTGASSPRVTADALRQIESLVPGWFYPVLWKSANRLGKDEKEKGLTEANRLAKTDAERRLLAKYRADLAENEAINARQDTPRASDRRPMTDGRTRRAQMAHLKADATLLKSLAG